MKNSNNTIWNRNSDLPICSTAHYTRVIQKLKIQIGWKGKGNHRCEGGNTVVSNILPFQFVFAFTKTSDRPEGSRRRRGENRTHYTTVGAGVGVLCHQNTKTGTEGKEMHWRRSALCWKIAKSTCWRVFHSNLLINIVKKLLLVYIFWTPFVLIHTAHVTQQYNINVHKQHTTITIGYTLLRNAVTKSTFPLATMQKVFDLVCLWNSPRFILTVKPTRCTNVSNLFILEWHSTCFGRSFRPSSGVQGCAYGNRHVPNR